MARGRSRILCPCTVLFRERGYNLCCGEGKHTSCSSVPPWEIYNYQLLVYAFPSFNLLFLYFIIYFILLCVIHKNARASGGELLIIKHADGVKAYLVQSRMGETREKWPVRGGWGGGGGKGLEESLRLLHRERERLSVKIFPGECKQQKNEISGGTITRACTEIKGCN